MNSLKNIVGIRFKKRGKIYSFDATDISMKKNGKVIVNTENGLAIGIVATEVKHLPQQNLSGDLRKVVRNASEEDLKVEEENIKIEKEGFTFCAERIRERNLPMKLVDVECLLDKSQIVFYFTADNRVDFRELVKDLVQQYKTRIELRQIWVRTEARICGGIGMCGRELCCVSFLNNFAPISIKMAKEQNMLLNPEKISGLCGRLMCCLAYEYDSYQEAKRNMPRCGTCINTREGKGKIVKVNVLQEKVIVELEDEREVEVSLSEIQD